MCNCPGLTVGSLNPSALRASEKDLCTLLPFLQGSLTAERGWAGGSPAETPQWGGRGDSQGCWRTDSDHLLKRGLLQVRGERGQHQGRIFKSGKHCFV